MRIRTTLACLVLAGCTASGETSPAHSPETHRRELDTAEGSRVLIEGTTRPGAILTVAVPADEAFAALPAVYAELGLGGAVADPAGRVYGRESFVVRRRLAGVPLSRYLDCGTRMGIPNADAYAVRLAVATRVEPNGPGANLRTEIQATAQDSGRSDPPVRCGTTTELERRIAALVMRQ
jgi:hypothetical protein